MKRTLTVRLLFPVLLSIAAFLFSTQGVAAEPKATNQKAAKEKMETLKTQGADQQILDLKCADCHASVKDVQTRPKHYHGDCETCHSGGNEHRQALIKGEPGKGNISFPQVKECLSCHKSDKKLAGWQFSAHNKAESKCTDCHAFHTSPLANKHSLTNQKMDRNSTNCVKCHQDVTSRFNMSSHHPVKEGALSCISCHNPHGTQNTTLISKNEKCLSCHQALRGPMAFEHAPVVEDCMSCHTPHGSPNRRLLSVSQPISCLQCHAIAQGKHGYGTGPEPAPASGTRTISGAVLRGCTNCHSAIHGSHQDPLLRY